jgi:tetratricopeptide (TPR) repeat protein
MNKKITQKRVLIIESNSSLKQYYTNNVLKLGLHPTIVRSAEDVYDFLGSSFEGELVLVVMDWIIPGANGYVVVQKIKNDPRFTDTTFILCTSSLTTEDKVLLLELEITNILPKGVSSQTLIDTIKQVVNQQSRLSGIAKLKRQLELSLGENNIQEVEILLANETLRKTIFSDSENAHLASEVDLLRRKYQEACERMQNLVDEHASGFEKQGKQGINVLKCLSTLGKAYLVLGKYAESEKVFAQLASISPQNLVHKINEADALIGQSKTDDARAKLSSVVELDSTNPAALAGMGKSHLMDGNPEMAAQYFNAIEGTYESPTFAGLFNNRGVGLVQSKKNEEAISLYENALKFMKKDRTSVMFNLGMAYLRSGKPNEAVSILLEVLLTAKPEFIARKTVLVKLKELGKDEFLKQYSSEVDLSA